MEQKSHIISQNVFGTSRKIQFIGLTTAPRHPMESLLNAIESAESTDSTNVQRHSYSNHDSNRSVSTQRRSMSIKSLLAGEPTTTREVYNHPRQSATASTNEVTVDSLLTSDPTTSSVSPYTYNSKRRREEDEQRLMKIRKNIKKTVSAQKAAASNSSMNTKNDKTIITCYHASVAQKSYGSEKRFLCPPPMVQIKPSTHSKLTEEQRCERLQLSMSVINENGEKVIEQASLLDENQSCSFKYLHVTGTAKAKQFKLAVDLLPTATNKNEEDDKKPLATFISKPISIISKPSKKAAKTRNVSTCILTTSPVSLFNRINSQTVRTKYMTTSNSMLCAKNTTWSPFDIIVVNQPAPTATTPTNTTSTSNQYNRSSHQQHRFTTTRLQLPPQQQQSSSSTNKAPSHISYGTEIILRETHTGVMSPPLIIRKVDKGRIAPCAYGPVSQMQKVALQLASSVDAQPIYLSASGSNSTLPQQHMVHSQHDNEIRTKYHNNSSNAWLDFSPSRLVQPEQMKLELSYEEVDDYLCWTIVGINKFEYGFIENDNHRGATSSASTATQINRDRLITHIEECKPNLSSPRSPISSPIPSSETPSLLPPLVTNLVYQDNHTLAITFQHAIQQQPSTSVFDVWLGTHGPLNSRVQSRHQYHYQQQNKETHLTVELPLTQDLLVANHDLLVTREDGHRILELPLMLVRSHDGTVYPTGRALSCDVVDDAFRWMVVTSSTSSPSTSSPTLSSFTTLTTNSSASSSPSTTSPNSF